jgi:hypothetical protein
MPSLRSRDRRSRDSRRSSLRKGCADNPTKTKLQRGKAPKPRGDPFSIADDIISLEQIKDIQDELQILKGIFKDQETVVNQFYKLHSPADHGKKAKETVTRYRNRVQSMLDRADPTYRAVRKLIVIT